MFLYCLESYGVLYRCLNFPFVSHYAGVFHEAFDVGVGEGCDFVDVKICKCLLNSWPFIINYAPVQTCLKNNSNHVLKIRIIIWWTFFSVPPFRHLPILLLHNYLFASIKKFFCLVLSGCGCPCTATNSFSLSVTPPLL